MLRFDAPPRPVAAGVLRGLGVTNRQLAAEIHYSEKHVSRVLTGMARPTPGFVALVERATGLPASVYLVDARFCLGTRA